MKITINFYLDDGLGTRITTFYDASSNPFKEGDKIRLDINELTPADYSKYNLKMQENLIEENEKLIKTFRLKSILLKREIKYMRFDSSKDHNLTIDYYCDIVE